MIVRWGIIGVGDVTEVKSGPGFQKATNSQLVAVMRRNGDLARDYAERHNIPHWYDDAQALINDPEVDAVYIATPPHVHEHYTRMCADAGKHVFVEKPMALTQAQCLAMVDVCHQANVRLWVAYYRRTLPRFLKIKSIIDSGQLGRINSVNVKLHRPLISVDNDELPWRVLPEIAGGGLILDVGVHMLDFLDYVLGPIQAVQGHAINHAGSYPAEDHVVGSFVFESGVLGTGEWYFNSYKHLDETTITGTHGEIRYSTFDTAPITIITAEGTHTLEIDNPPHVHQPLIQSIVDEMNGEGECPSTGISGARTAWVIDELLKTYHQTD